jgi:VanZ family protein
MPSHDLPHFTRIKEIDKVIHLCMYLGLSLLASWNYDISHKRMKFMYLLLAGVFMYGVIMEILQRTMHNGRDFEFKDMIANLTGTVIGLMIYRFIDRKHDEMKISSTDHTEKIG